ncbi:MAG: sigma-54-dependent Fis family transcriptional regulator [Candidatus Abyssobacteria bacterium SURF_5]|uniref:Sigma-54-dependent Fis family transcriptional regulator n=1 Tax=Abyssobacteria bacterium (strain SURF_5) TaxID=2093360 RepID=A0A3A4NIW5_ABYX5|nr:MAG: sigma-54-dependent Fis family transcriptional regulator [Candidatus Abyssubacteria bacterium SURF_5]
MERILIVDDDEGLIHFLSRFFSKMGKEVVSSTNGPAALDKISSESFDLILIDYKMPGLNGLDTLKEIRKRRVKTPVIIMTAYGTTETAIEAMKLGAYDYLLKPFDRDQLHRIAADALEVNRLMKEVVTLPAGYGGLPVFPQESVRIVGSHRKMQEVYKLIGQVAEKDVTVLITGESGTGKELVAKAIYHHSTRKNRPFLTINCAAIPDTLFESELFGYERGAFTGAERTHIGKFERGAGGTMFFDEIGDMSLATQAKVLRVLQEGDFERLAGSETIKADVRIIAATNKNLMKAVDNGEFREDLYWRLKIISIDLPPLRERAEDIPELTQYFFGRFCGEYQKSIRHIADPAIEKLKSYSWPGNVRELENCIKRAVLLCTGDVIGEEHIKLETQKDESRSSRNHEQLMSDLRTEVDGLISEVLKLSNSKVHANIVELVEEMLINRALKECANNQVRTARMLGISRNTLRHRMRKYRITSNEE